MSKMRYAPASAVRKFYPYAYAKPRGHGFDIIVGNGDPRCLGSGVTRFQAWHEAWCAGCLDKRREAKRASLGEEV